MGHSRKRRPPDVRSAQNARYHDGRVVAGIARICVMVPIDRVPELRALTLAWRVEAKLVLESDRPTADQILQIHGVCGALGIRLPLKAFESRAAATQWLFAHEAALGLLRVQTPRVGART